MKKIWNYLLAATLLTGVGCHDDDNTLPEIRPEKTGSFSIGENEYEWARYNGLDWMTSNFKEGERYYRLTTIDSWGYEDLLIDTDTLQAYADWDNYGNMYTYEEALANVELLPKGWRLPTDEDWKKLEQAMGMSESDANVSGIRGSVEGELLQQGTNGTGMLLRFGGFVLVHGRPATLRHRHLREYGYFRTATVAEASEDAMFAPAVYFRKISCTNSQIERNATKTYDTNYEGNFPKYMSVRYVRDAVD